MSAKADELIIRRALTALEQIEALGCYFARYEPKQRCVGEHPCASCIAHRALHP